MPESENHTGNPRRHRRLNREREQGDEYGPIHRALSPCDRPLSPGDRRSHNGRPKPGGCLKVKNITKLAIILGLLLQVGGHPVKHEMVGWDYCTEEGHPFDFVGYRFGWPIPLIRVGQIWGCLSTPNQWVDVDWGVLPWDISFWLVVLNILERWWPIDG